MNNYFSFALPSGYDYDVKEFTKKVKTKAFYKLHANKLSQYADQLLTTNSDTVQVIGAMLQAAYGANIGRQIESKLKESDFVKIKQNIYDAVYK